MAKTTRTVKALRGASTAATTRTRRPRGAGDTTAQAVSRLVGRGEELAAGLDATRNTTLMQSAQGVPRLLMVIDDFMMRVNVRDLAEQAGLIVDSSPNPEAALQKFYDEGYTLVVTDSLETIRDVRSLPVQAQPHILFTVDSDPENGIEGLNAGADDCFSIGSAPELIRAKLAVARRVAALETALASSRSQRKAVEALDPLTHAGTRRFFDQQFPKEIRSAARRGAALSIAICDIDHFKRINDQHGHAIGDKVLREFVRRIENILRERQDWVARIGGEEFAIVFTRTDTQEARGLTRRIRLVICSAPFRIGDLELHVSASFGLAGSNKLSGAADATADRLKTAADRALYRSKDVGRNRVTVALMD